MRTVAYSTWDERQILCDNAEAGGEQMLHDETQAGIPTLVFDWPQSDPPATPPNESQLRQERITELLQTVRSDWTTAQLRELVELLCLDKSANTCDMRMDFGQS